MARRLRKVQPLNRCRTYRLLYSGLGKLVDRSLVDETCLVVDSRRVRREALPRSEERGITKIGKDAYPTAQQAEADVKRLCKESKADSQARQQRRSVKCRPNTLQVRAGQFCQ